MQITVSGHHLDITDALRNYVLSKCERMERHFDHLTNIHVVLGIEKQRQKAEATVHIAGGNIYADAEDENMYAAIDSMVDKLDRQILRHKSKIRDHHRSSGGLKAQ